MSNKILLPNGNKMSVPSVNPKNWKTGISSLMKKDWYIQYYFYEPDIKKGKFVLVRGMNSEKELIGRQALTQVIIDEQIDLLKMGYNPILKKIIKEVVNNTTLTPYLFFIDAFRNVMTKIQCTEKHRKEVGWCIDRLEKHAVKVGLQNVVIEQLKRRQLKQLLDACNLPSSYYNKYIAFLSSIFRELVEYECCSHNIVRDIRKRKIVQTQREVMSTTELDAVMSHLKSNHYEFWRYAQIFLYSGARTTELFRIQAKDVNIDMQEYNTIIMKGSNPHETTKVILKEVLPLWKEMVHKAKPDHYIFARGLIAGEEPIKPYQITLRWLRLVKNSEDIKDENGEVLKITADFYSLKHTFLDSLPREMAMLMASHTNSTTTAIYRVNEEKRTREILKNMKL
ncbi:MAG: tyrosine-type recombinase/integrase [Gelidibacter sp.]